MGVLYVGDSGKRVKFRFATGGDVDGTTVTAMRVKVKRPAQSNAVEWSTALVPGETNAATVTGEHVLVAGDVPVAGQYGVRAWLYNNGSQVGDSIRGTFQVDRSDISAPE